MLFFILLNLWEPHATQEKPVVFLEYLNMDKNFNINDLFNLILERRTNPQPGSYTNHLFDKGEDEIIKKVGEEAIEVVLASKAQSNQRVIEEIADLTYHTLVLLAYKGITPSDITSELQKRNLK